MIAPILFVPQCSCRISWSGRLFLRCHQTHLNREPPPSSPNTDHPQERVTPHNDEAAEDLICGIKKRILMKQPRIQYLALVLNHSEERVLNWEKRQREVHKSEIGCNYDVSRDVWKLQNRKVIVHFDEDSGQPDEDSGGLLVSWLGQLSTDVNLLPINYSDCRTYSPSRKDKAWELIQAKFWSDDPMAREDYVIGVLGSRCKDLKLRLWKEYKQNTLTETIANRPPHVPVDQWRDLVSMRFTEKWKRTQERNTRSRRKHTLPHICGRKSFARKRRQITGKTPSRAQFFITTRKKSDGSFVSDEAKKRADELTVLLAQNPSTQVSNNLSATLDDEYSQVFGRERSGRVRCVGRGPTPSKLYKRSAATRYEAEKLEANQMKITMSSLQNEVGSLKGIIQELLTSRSNDPEQRDEVND